MQKSVLITGVSGGIGEAIAREFAKNGYDVVGTYNNNQVSRGLKEYCAEHGVKLYELKLDITNSEEVKQVFDVAFKLTKNLSCVVCNSGISLGEKMLCDNSDEEIDKLVQTNLVGTIYCNREASRHFISQKRGSIVNISSVYGQYGGSCESVYSATKAGIIGLTQGLAVELGGAGIRVNAVAPGCIDTKMTAGYSGEELQQVKAQTPLNRIGAPEDVAKAVYFLGGEDSFMTGETLTVSGGVLRF